MAMMILVGDVNLMNVEDAGVPFARLGEELRAADLVFANLECLLYEPPDGHAVEHEGFFADPEIAGEALQSAGIAAVGLANNVNYGAAAILGSIARLDGLGIAPHRRRRRSCRGARAGDRRARRAARRLPAAQLGLLADQPRGDGEHGAGIAVIRGHTAYQVPAHKTRPEIPPMNRPGVPPIVVTWADRAYLAALRATTSRRCAAQADIVVASCHWGLGEEVLDYMTEIAHAAIDAGADIVIGHGPHYSLPVEIYRGKPIFYGLGSFSFHTGHGGRRHGDWIGMMARGRDRARAASTAARFRFVRHNERNETVPCPLADEGATLDRLTERSTALGARLIPEGHGVRLAL